MFCRDCQEVQRIEVGFAAEAHCPECHHPLEIITKPTGRKRLQTRQRPEKLETILVMREGPVPPDNEYLQDLFRKISPDVAEDQPRIMALPVFPWPDSHDQLQRQAMVYLEDNGIYPAAEQIDCYFAGARDREGNDWCIVKVYQRLQDADLQELRRLAERHPKNARVHEALAMRCLKEGYYDDANEHIRIAVEQDPSIGEHSLVMTEELRKFNEALDLIEQAQQLFQIGNYRKAKPLYQRLSEEAPNWAEAWNGLGLCEFYTGYSARAIECLQHALAIKPDYPPAHCNLGLLTHHARRLQLRHGTS